MKKHPRVLALVLAGGEGNRMGALTKHRAKPALPFGGSYRLIDFPLSNCVHSQLGDVWVIEQFQPHSINEHLTSGRPWDLDRTHGGLRMMTPHKAAEEDADGWHQGNADALWRNARFIREYSADIVLVLSADGIYTMDYRDVIEAHLKNKAEVTMVVKEINRKDAFRFGTVQHDENGIITHFEYKPDEPQSSLVTIEVFAYDAPVLLQVLEELGEEARRAAATKNRATAKKKGKKDADSEPALRDFGHELLPHLVKRGKAFAYRFEGYWQDVGTMESYFQSHMDLLDPDSPLHLDNPDWPIRTRSAQRMPMRVLEGAQIENALIAPGATVVGTVKRSVLAPGVVVEKGATVEDCVVGYNVRIQSGAKVRYAVIDDDVIVTKKNAARGTKKNIAVIAK